MITNSRFDEQVVSIGGSHDAHSRDRETKHPLVQLEGLLCMLNLPKLSYDNIHRRRSCLVFRQHRFLGIDPSLQAAYCTERGNPVFCIKAQTKSRDGSSSDAVPRGFGDVYINEVNAAHNVSSIYPSTSLLTRSAPILQTQ
jgi:hypothetical protein